MRKSEQRETAAQACARMAKGYREAWARKFPGTPIKGSILYLVEKLERIARKGGE